MAKGSVVWFASNAVLIGAVVAGFVMEIQLAKNLSVGFVWIMLFAYLSAASNPGAVKRIRAKGRTVPRRIEWVVDILILGIFLWGFAYLTALAFVGSCLVLERIYLEKNISGR